VSWRKNVEIGVRVGGSSVSVVSVGGQQSDVTPVGCIFEGPKTGGRSRGWCVTSPLLDWAKGSFHLNPSTDHAGG
jgi:hypothetical protein